MKPVAEIVQREPFDDGSQNPCKAILWEGNNAEDDFPVGTKLYVIPADRVLVPRELLEAALKRGPAGTAEEFYAREKAICELRTLLHP